MSHSLPFLEVLWDALYRNGVRHSDLVAVASVGGGARIPAVTAALSERFRVPVITTPRPELAAANGAALRAAWGPANADTGSDAFPALAWSQAHVVAPIARPQLPAADETADEANEAVDETADEAVPVPGTAWYRRGSALAGIGGAALLLLAACAMIVFGGDRTAAPPTSSGQEAPLRTVYVTQNP